MFKIKQTITFSVCIMMLSVGVTSSVSAETSVGVPSLDAVVYSNPVVSTACISCTKRKLKSGMWFIGTYRQNLISF